MSLLEIKNLKIDFPSRNENFCAINGISFTLRKGEILGLIGESGAGKSTVGNAIVGLLSPPGRISSGIICLQGKPIQNLNSKQMRLIRGRKIGFIFQDPMVSLNPLLTIQTQLIEAIRAHKKISKALALARAISLLKAVEIPDPEHRIKQYPYQFSGGMRQRVVIAIALSGEPDLVIADEPTTALDVSVQYQTLKLIRKLCQQRQMGCLLITHDMGVIAQTADRIGVLYQGNMVEYGEVNQVLFQPEHSYTKNLLKAVPPIEKKLKRFPQPTASHPQRTKIENNLLKDYLKSDLNIMESGIKPLLSLEDVCLTFHDKKNWFRASGKAVKAVRNISFSIKQGEVFGLVGESGSGKSTVARIITGLQPPDSGKITFAGQDNTDKVNLSTSYTLRRALQLVFQNPYASLNARMKVGNIIAEPIHYHKLLTDKRHIQKIVCELLHYVGLEDKSLEKYPHEFSGGQRQRICIARALALRPSLLICDEPTSALDVSVQAQVLNLLKQLQEELGLTMLFISHDLPVIRQMCDRVGVMRLGKLLEVEESELLFNCPKHNYTRELINLIPSFSEQQSKNKEAKLMQGTCNNR